MRRLREKKDIVRPIFRVRRWCRTVAIVPVCLVAACATEVARRDSGPVVGSQGASAELVFPGAEVALQGVPRVDGAARLDLTLNARGDTSAYPLDRWPTPPALSLDRQRRIYFSSSASSFLYFAPEPERGGGWWRGD